MDDNSAQKLLSSLHKIWVNEMKDGMQEKCSQHLLGSTVAVRSLGRIVVGVAHVHAAGMGFGEDKLSSQVPNN